MGDPALQAGAQVEVAGVPSDVRRQVDDHQRPARLRRDGGRLPYPVLRQRPAGPLAARAGLDGRQPGQPTRIPGLVCGIVTNNNDPNSQGRGQGGAAVAVPGRTSRTGRGCVQFGAGKTAGRCSPPRSATRCWSASSSATRAARTSSAGCSTTRPPSIWAATRSKRTGLAGTVVRRGFVTGAGNRLVFEDELMPPPGAGPPLKSAFALRTGDGKMGVDGRPDRRHAQADLRAEPAGERRAPPEAGDHRERRRQHPIKAGAGGSVKIDGGANLELTALQSVKISARAWSRCRAPRSSSTEGGLRWIMTTSSAPAGRFPTGVDATGGIAHRPRRHRAGTGDAADPVHLSRRAADAARVRLAGCATSSSGPARRTPSPSSPTRCAASLLRWEPRVDVERVRRSPRTRDRPEPAATSTSGTGRRTPTTGATSSSPSTRSPTTESDY